MTHPRKLLTQIPFSTSITHVISLNVPSMFSRKKAA
jgi:hypothetical protein